MNSNCKKANSCLAVELSAYELMNIGRKGRRAEIAGRWQVVLSSLFTVHSETKSSVDLPWKCEFLGFSFTAKLKRRIGPKSIKKFKAKVREMTFRTRGARIGKIVEELRRYLSGWQAYFRGTLNHEGT